MPESLPVGTTVLTEGLYRGRIDGAVALANSSAIFLVDAETVVEVEFSGLSSQDVVRVEGVTAYLQNTRTYYIRVRKITMGVRPIDRVMAVLKKGDAKAQELIEVGKWARDHASEYNDESLRKLAEKAFIDALKVDEFALKPADYEGYFRLAKTAEELGVEPGFRETYVRGGINAYILATGKQTAQTYYDAAKKAQELLPGSMLPDLLIEQGWMIECGGAAPKSAADYIALSERAKELFGEGLSYHRLLSKSLDVDYQAISPSDYTAFYALARRVKELYPDYANYRNIVTKGISAEKAAMDQADPRAWLRLGNRILYFFNDKHQTGVAWRTAASIAPANQEIRAKLRDLGFVYYRGNWWWADDFGKSDLFKQVQEWEALVAAHEVTVGMSQDQVIRSKGMPAERCASAGLWGVTTQWVYRDEGKVTYLAFMADTLVSKGEVKAEQ